MVAFAIPAVVEAVVVGGNWGYRAYQAWRLARTAQAVITAGQALDQLEAAQQAAKADDKAGGKTAAQSKADAAVSSNCTNCNEDPDCQTARNKLKEALYGTKGEDAQNRGLAERLCHWLHGTSDAQNDSHMRAVKEAATRVDKALKWLTGESERPFGKKEGATLTKKQKEKKLKDCDMPQDWAGDAKLLLDEAKAIADEKPTMPRLPRADFAIACSGNALGLIKKALGN